MSELNPIIEISFYNRKPSKAKIMRTLGVYLEQGGKSFSLFYGENWIDLDYHYKYKQWMGRGWIKDISGDDIAKELNSIRQQAIEEIKTLNLWNT